jgi:hypothetical protein
MVNAWTVPGAESVAEADNGVTLMIASGSQRMMKFTVGLTFVGVAEFIEGDEVGYGMGHWPPFVDPKYVQ